MRPGGNRIEARASRNGKVLNDHCVWSLKETFSQEVQKWNKFGQETGAVPPNTVFAIFGFRAARLDRMVTGSVMDQSAVLAKAVGGVASLDVRR